MAAHQTAKVLRIGIIQDGKIAQERLTKVGETVTVGESPKATFVFPKTHLPKAEFPLFIHNNGKYSLSFTEEMEGKISSGGAVVSLEKVKKDPTVERQGGVYLLELTEHDRGKLAIDGVTVLFQFVAPPPTQAVKPLQAMDFRPRLIEEDDPIFLGFLAVFAALAVVLMVWVWNTEPKPITRLEDLPDRFVKLVLEKDPSEKDKPEIDPTTLEGEKVKREEKQEPDKTEGGEKKEPKTAAEKAKRAEELKQSAIQNSALLKMIVGRGEVGRAGTAEDFFADDDSSFGDLDSALRGAGGAKVATSDDMATKGLRGGQGGGDRGDADIGDLGGVGGGKSGVGGGPEVKISGTVSMEGSGDIGAEIGDAGKVKTVVQNNYGTLKYCYEKELKANPKLAGRVEVVWNILDGRVTSASVLSNNTGSDPLGACIVSKIKRWGFDPSESGEIVWPFVFAPKN